MTFLLVVHTLLALALVGVILMQKSEGGGLTGGSTPAGLVSARGASDLLTRTTSILAALFIITSLWLAMLASNQSKPQAIDTSLSRAAAPGPNAPPVAPVLPAGVPAAPGPAPVAPAPLAPPAPGAPAGSVPLAN